MDLSNVSDASMASEYASGYHLMEILLHRRVRDPWAVISEAWESIELSDARVRGYIECIPGLVYRPTSPHVLTARLMLAFEDFLGFANPDSPDTLAHQFETRGRQWGRRFDVLSVEEDDDE